MLTLRDYQARMHQETANSFRAGHKGVLNVLPTGGGKGEMLAHWLGECVRWGRRAVIACHLKEILKDVRQRLVKRGLPEPRLLFDGSDDGPADSPITVASWQTMHARTSELDVSLFIADEAHRSMCETAMGVLERHSSSRLLGFTATAQRADGSGLGDAGFTTIIQGPQIQEMVRDGHLAPCTVIAPDEYVTELAWDPVDAWLRWAPRGAGGIVFASTLEHSRAIARGLSEQGLAAMHVDSDTPDAAREWAVAALETGELDVICNKRLWCEGVNVLRASVAMLASSFSHDGPYLQAIGRPRRTHPSKARALILDLRGNIHRRGHPDEDRTYHLDGQAVRRASFDLPPVVCCPNCLSWSAPRSVCEMCGAERPPPKPPRISKREMREQAMERAPRHGADWDLWVRLVQQGRARGWKPGAAFMRFVQETGGRKPKWGHAQVPEVGGERKAS